MRKKLIVSAFSMIIIILLIVAGNQVIIKLFANFSQKLITEYHELHSLQELKVSLSKSVTYLNFPSEHNTPGFHDEMESALTESFKKMDVCKEVLSEVHKGNIWTNTISEFSELKSNSLEFFSVKVENLENKLAWTILASIEVIITNIDEMVDETLEEINEYEARNKKVVQHGTITVLVFGIILILFLAIGGLKFIKTLTRPIDQLVEAMKKIGKGNTEIRVKVDSDDEFLFLADSFNSMLETLNTTTVSKDFFSKILNNLFGAVVVTDEFGRINFINESACRLLDCNNIDLLGQDSISLFNCKTDDSFKIEPNTDLESYAAQLRKMTEMRTTDGKLIPVYVTCTILKDREGESNGMVVVGHDLTEEKANEEKIERIRKERLIAINEAEENERIRIAKDLHDGLGQILTGISYSVQNIEPADSSEEELLDRIHQQIDSAIQEAKNISHNLTPVILRDFGLVAAIDNLVAKTNLLNKTKIIFNSYDFEERIDQRLEKTLFRICQEGLHNIMKHARAESATIELFREYKQIAMVIEDNGLGFDINSKQNNEGLGGIGLLSMRERVYVFDGNFIIDSQVNRGTEIIVEIPCPEKRSIYGKN